VVVGLYPAHVSAAGGAGKTYSINGTSTGYAGGGGGGNAGGGTNGSATDGGGSGSGGNGTANRGGGGAGEPIAGSAAGSGGSGIVVIAYPDSYPALTSIGGGLTYTQPTRAGYRVYQFTAGTGTVTI